MVALAVRLLLYGAGGLYAAVPADPVVVEGDAIEYDLLGRALADRGRFQYDAGSPVAHRRTIAWTPETLRTPGYPLFVALFYRLFGPLPGIPILFQLLLEAGTCLLIATAFRGALGVRGAGVAALAYALHPSAALFSNLLYSEALFTFVLVAAFAVLARALAGRPERRGLGLVTAAGLLFGLAALVRPVLLPLLPVLAVAVLLVWRRRWPRAALGVLGLALLFALPLLPWALRNRAAYGHASLSTSGAYNLVTLYAAPASGLRHDTLLARADAAARREGVALHSDFDRAPYWRAEARRVIGAHAAAFVRLQVVGAVRLFLSAGRDYRAFVFGPRAERPPPGGGVGARLRWWLEGRPSDVVQDVWAALYALLAYPLLAVGTVAAWRRGQPDRRTLLLAALLVLYLVVVTGTPGHSRFMAPIIPFWAPFVAVGLLRLRPSLRPHGDGP